MRGQLSIESLSGYGWAIVGIMLMFAALIYFGVVPVGAMIPDQCFIRDFACRDKSTAGTNVVFALKNVLPEAITIFYGSDPSLVPSGSDRCPVQDQLSLLDFNGNPNIPIPAGGIAIDADSDFKLSATLRNAPAMDSPCTFRFFFERNSVGLKHTAEISYTYKS